MGHCSFSGIDKAMSVAVVCIIFDLFNKPVNAQIRVYHPDVPIEIDPPETPHHWITFLDILPRLRYFTEPSKYFGTTIAGQAEFPWVVDIRHLDLYEEGWAIGNLVNPSWVLTVCSILRDWQRVEQCAGISETNSYSVYFCTNYVFEDYYRYNADNVVQYHLTRGGDDDGIRKVVKIVRHPKCKNTLKRTWNFALMKVSNPIPVYVPVTGYIPFYQEPGQGGDEPLNLKEPVYPVLQKMDHRGMKKVCYLASFGRPYWNENNPQNKDYKVKYRAYFSPYSHCASGLEHSTVPYRLCINNGNEPNQSSEGTIVNPTCLESVRKNGGISGQFICIRTYAKHGAACDHDRGAPLVCNGEVYGFITRGVPWNFCINTRMFPVLVIKVDYLKGANFGVQDPNFGNAWLPAPEF